MTTVIYCNVTPYETRVAVREGGALVELLVERSRERSVVGSLFKGRISRVLPGMQAAFVNIGLERDAFLYVDDVAEALEEDLEPGELVEGVPIQDLLREGQEILVQVTRELGAAKGPRATSHVTIPGRYLVLLPGSSHIGVSRRITDQTERERLRALLADIPHSCGVIVRTAGEGCDRADFQADLAGLESMWRHILKRADEVGAPCLVHRDLDLVLRAARDLTGPNLAEFWVDDPEAYQRVVEFLDRLQPELTSRVKLYRRQIDIFDAFGIEAELQQVLQPKVWLRSGGSLVINQTEALVAIDVNTGRYVGSADLEDTVCLINLEAAREVARQLRLRNLGGIIVIDFIDMDTEDHREKVLNCLRSELGRDRSPTKTCQISSLGLVEMTRKRVRPSLAQSLSEPCSRCGGSGRVLSPLSSSIRLERLLGRVSVKKVHRNLVVSVHPDLAGYFMEEEGRRFEYLTSKVRLNIALHEDQRLRVDEFRVYSLDSHEEITPEYLK